MILQMPAVIMPPPPPPNILISANVASTWHTLGPGVFCCLSSFFACDVSMLVSVS